MVCYFEQGNETTDSMLFSYFNILRHKTLVTKILCNYVAWLHSGGVLEVRNTVLRLE